MRIALISLPLVLVAVTGYFALASATPTFVESPQFKEGKFGNPVPMRQHTLGEQAKMWWGSLVAKPAGGTPAQEIPVQRVSKEALASAPDNTMYRLGHSSVLLKLASGFYLTDPMFSERASPVQWAGPLRFQAPPISIDDLPPLKAVIISHDHYDHLDSATVLDLAAKTELFLTPLGVGDRMIEWGIDAAKVRQLDWWQETELNGVRIIATPARHFSGRSLTDRNSTLWASWVIQQSDLRLFFSGDTGYFAGFKEIGEKYGPFDATLLEIGSYDKQWPDVHMQPEEAFKAFADLKGKWLVPIHNGMFDMALHRWQEPLERTSALAKAQGVALATPMIGEPINLKNPQAGHAWWDGLK